MQPMAAVSPQGDENEVAEGLGEESNVKSETEINGITNGANDVATQNGTKRKLPLWMVTANNNKYSEEVDTTQNKRCKINDENNEDADSSNEPFSGENVQNEQEDVSQVVNTHEAQNSDNTKERISLVDTGVDETVNNNENNEDADSSNEPFSGENVQNEQEDVSQVVNTHEAQNSDNTKERISSVDAGVDETGNNSDVKIKVEPMELDASNIIASTSNGNTSDIKPAVKVEKADASSTSRESCKYGIRCYRRNPMHRCELAHPGDDDYKRPHYPPPPNGVPDCPYGNGCYRRNPTHFQAYKHPDDTDFQQNYRNYRLRQLKRVQPQNNINNDDSDDLDDYDLDDPFINDDSDLDYFPSSDEEDCTEELDYDDCDKAEE